jgi:hypothetical protein
MQINTRGRYISGKYVGMQGPTDRCTDLKVPMEGKYMPTHASKAKKAAIKAARLVCPIAAATAIDEAAVPSITIIISISQSCANVNARMLVPDIIV